MRSMASGLAGLRRASRSLKPALLGQTLQSGVLAPAATQLAVPRKRPAVEQRDMSSRALAKMGELGTDKLASSPGFQSAEYVMTQFDRLANWARKASMWPMTFGLA